MLRGDLRESPAFVSTWVPSASSFPDLARMAPSGSSVLTCRVRLPVPPDGWMERFGQAFPAVRMDVADRLEVGDGITVFEVRLHGRGAGHWAEAIGADPDIVAVELLSRGPELEVLRVFFRGATYVPLLKRLRLMRQFPFPVRAGVATWTVTGPAPKVRSFLRTLSEEVPTSRVELVRAGPEVAQSPLLTARQREILERALAEGYFEVPRRISLTALAKKIGVAASTLSVALAVIERKIVQAHR